MQQFMDTARTRSFRSRRSTIAVSMDRPGASAMTSNSERIWRNCRPNRTSPSRPAAAIPGPWMKWNMPANAAPGACIDSEPCKAESGLSFTGRPAWPVRAEAPRRLKPASHPHEATQLFPDRSSACVPAVCSAVRRVRGARQIVLRSNRPSQQFRQQPVFHLRGFRSVPQIA
jgi:hypothetical protein